MSRLGVVGMPTMGLNKGLAFHPTLPRLLVPSPLDHGQKRSRAGLHIFELDLEILNKNRRNSRQPRAVHYVNAKVVLVGDTGVGKSGLALVLNGQPYEKIGLNFWATCLDVCVIRSQGWER
jgi:hypothetical protein